MFGCDCFYWRLKPDYYSYFDSEIETEPKPFSLPTPLPLWPQGEGFASGRICLGELEVTPHTKLERAWSCKPIGGKIKEGITFYKPIDIPDGFHCLGYYSQLNDHQLRDSVLVARELNISKPENCHENSTQKQSLELPALAKPIDYTLIWNTCEDYDDDDNFDHGFFWQPNPPKGYEALGFLVTNRPDEPATDEIRCVRSDLTERCESCNIVLDLDCNGSSFQVWNSRPCERGMLGTGVPAGTFFCTTCPIDCGHELNTVCLKNMDPFLHSMPNLDQVHALIKHYGPTVYFHPDEMYLPSSVEWFFENGALLYEQGVKNGGTKIDPKGSNLPKGDFNDGEYWIDLPSNEEKRDRLKCGNLESAELYVHVKPALGGTFTDIVMWVFAPFNGPATLKVGPANISMNKVGEHVGDWEHFTLRVSNFNGELRSVYFSQHSGGEWIDVRLLEFMDGGNKPIVYSSKDGHASFPHPGCYLWGPTKIKVGVRNDVARSKYVVDSSVKYRIVAAEYMDEKVVEEPCWLQYMREWGPTIVYDSSSEIEKIVNHLPIFVRLSLKTLMDLFPTELYGEQGPTGPKEKNNWYGDERW